MRNGSVSFYDWCYRNNCTELLEYLKDRDEARLYSHASRHKYLWVCERGHEYVRDTGFCIRPSLGTYKRFSCPVCNGQVLVSGVNDLSTLYPEIAKELDEERSKVRACDIAPTRHGYLWWKCKRGHSYRQRVDARTYTQEGCPECSAARQTSVPEMFLYYYLSKVTSAENRLKLDGVEFDIVLPDLRVAIEYDGVRWHANKNTHWKEDFIKSRGFSFYRVVESYDHVFDRFENTWYYFPKAPLYNTCYPAVISGIISELGLCAVDINLKRDYKVVLNLIDATINSSYVMDSVGGWVAEHWDYKLNGYSYTLCRNDNIPKYFRCDRGHSFKRRVDVVNRGSTICPICKGKFTGSLFCFYGNNSYVVYDRDDSVFELVPCSDIVKALESGINIKGLDYIDGKPVFNSNWVKDTPESTFYAYFCGTIGCMSDVSDTGNTFFNKVLKIFFGSISLREKRERLVRLLYSTQGIKE